MIIIHAAKIPEAIQSRSRDTRMLAGDMVYVNACNDKPWKKPPDMKDVEAIASAVPCRACMYIVEYNRNAKD